MPKIIEPIRSILQLFFLQCYLSRNPFMCPLQLQKHSCTIPLILCQTSQLHLPQLPGSLSLYCYLFLKQRLLLQQATNSQPNRIQSMLIGISQISKYLRVNDAVRSRCSSYTQANSTSRRNTRRADDEGRTGESLAFKLYTIRIQSLIMEQIPAYIIKYLQCKTPGHEGEKVNLVCLGANCAGKALICSMCVNQGHHGHTFRPLKIYLDQLYRRYRGQESPYNQQLQELERRKLSLLLYLQNCVERIADKFRTVEQDIIVTYQRIREQLHQNESRRGRFQQFYQSMIKQNYGDPHFQIGNFLFSETLQTLTDEDIFQDIASKMSKAIQSLKHSFVKSQSKQVISEPIQDLKQIVNKNTTLFKVPPNILCEQDILRQTLTASNSPNLCLFHLQFSKWTGRLRVNFLSLPEGSKVSFGILVKYADYDASNYIFKPQIFTQYLDTNNIIKGSQQPSNIKGIKTGEIMQFFVKKQNLRADYKNKSVIFNIGDKSGYLVMALQGAVKVKISYPYK